MLAVAPAPKKNYLELFFKFHNHEKEKNFSKLNLT